MPSTYETTYLNLIGEVIESGHARQDRTGVGTKAVFGREIRMPLSEGFPLLTTKRVAYRAAFIEMLWMLSGGDNIRPLLEQGVHIWSEWPHQKYVQATGDDIDIKTFEARVLEDDAFAARWADTGGAYGVQWRRWEGPDGRVYDQIADVLDALLTNPGSRRMLWSGWNVPKLSEMMLPPCHVQYQCFVDDNGLSVLCSQRSADLGLGVPFNCASTALICVLFARLAGLPPHEAIWYGGDCHVYSNHIEPLRTQLERQPTALPTLTVTGSQTAIEDFRLEDLHINDYAPQDTIRMQVAV